jgi:outer membrane protein assembly factor BamE (lipoprotein component of BamABCDE complex)
LTFGATKDDVLRLLGTPSRVSGNRWYYGFSEVRFKEGRLIGYDNFFDHFAVRTAPSKPAASSVPQDYFTLGSTQEDVVAVQGAPTSIQGNLWFYRSSTVLFRDGKVQWVSDTEGMLRFVAPEDVQPTDSF